MIESDISAFLKSDPAINTAVKDMNVGLTPSTTVYPVVGIYRSGDSEPEPFATLQDVIVSIKACDKSYVSAFKISDAIKVKLKGYKGTMGDSQIVHITAPDRVPLYDDTFKRWEVTQDYHIRVRL